ncbi:hypothetical protein DICPUDRAFT_155955 [Dictyostelium purpureum]|uniref:Expansin-like EG45 domain-containing protein n=1 Tax=Dictyostelium purpureum TaxID=5786 RepID=F0ZVB7_DICPU|nr:uncharacterized protein DICPUDRAFT_155955 [Dictyostelium purpureum]EGC32117.1 hypothetical protein DICPUDRAFT_155955 [Dictyostelium purpureum]|eukprot:XP_003291367.1 hypothetical protein DICPUDRAFT_155955 [Dictyostelium purpureum]
MKAECPIEQVKHKSTATYYTDPQHGNCGYGELMGRTGPGTMMVAALSTKFYDDSKSCGQCFNIFSPYTNRSLVVMGTDKCPDKGWCEADYHFDLTTDAFDVLGPRLDGVLYNLEFYKVPCQIKGNVKVMMKDGSNPFWTSFLVFNSNIGVKQVSIKLSGSDQFKPLPITSYNYWDSPSMTPGEFELRIESIGGEFIYTKISSVESNKIIDTETQFTVEGCDSGEINYDDPYAPFRIPSDSSRILPPTIIQRKRK